VDLRSGVVVALLAGCGGGGAGAGGDSGWAGLYQVTHHTESQETCDTEGPVVPDSRPAFFRLNHQSDEYRYAPCDSPTDTTCDFGSIWFQGRGDRWTGDQPGSSRSGDLCTLYYYAWTLIHSPDGGVRIEIREFGGSGPASSCTADEARRRSTSLPCRRFEVIAGRPPGASLLDAGPEARPVDGAAPDADPGAPGGLPCVMRPCGGDLQGSWRITASCYSKGPDLAALACPRTAYDRKGLVTTGEITFDGGSYTMKLIHRGTITVSHSLSCPQTSTCAQLETSLRSADPTAPLTVSCRQSADLCLCTLEANGVHDDESGQYQLDNLLLTTSPAGSAAANPYQYCVQGPVMKMAGPIVAGPNGEKAAVAIYTLSRTP
jgi:hypothetical protein